MTCKDCAGFQFCKDFLDRTEFNNEYVVEDSVESVCKNFKDKSKFIELPCTVGDVVYQLIADDIRKTKIDNIEIYAETKVFYTELETVFFEWDYNISVFNTKEQAKTRLKELQQDN